MDLENFIRELGTKGCFDDKVVLLIHSLGNSYEVPVTYDRIGFAEGKVFILADDD